MGNAQGAARGGLKRDSPQTPVTEILEEQERRPLPVDAAPARHATTPFADRFEHRFRGSLCRVLLWEMVAGDEPLAVSLFLERGDERERHLFLTNRIAADRMTRGKEPAVVFDFDLWPHHPGGVVDRPQSVEGVTLHCFGDSRFIAHLGCFAPKKGVEQRRFADVGDTNDHDAQRFRGAVAVGGKTGGSGEHTADVGGVVGAKRQRRNLCFTLERRQPFRSADGIREVAFVEDFEARFLPAAAKRLQEWIAACRGNAGIQKLNHDIDLRERLFKTLAGSVHVAGEPLNGHCGGIHG